MSSFISIYDNKLTSHILIEILLYFITSLLYSYYKINVTIELKSAE